MTASAIKTYTRISRCGGLQALNRAQKQYVNRGLRRMFDVGRILEGRCYANAPLLVLVDKAYGDGRIAFVTGTAEAEPYFSREFHCWCQLDGVNFEITYPLWHHSVKSLRAWIPHIEYSAKLVLKADDLFPVWADDLDALLCELGALDHLSCRSTVCDHNLNLKGAVALRKALPTLKKSSLWPVARLCGGMSFEGEKG